MTLRKRRPGLVYPTRDDWHYVGETDEPAFEESWVNEGAGQAMAFRIRESGIVDIHGAVTGGGTGSTVFTLPAGYRPATESTIPAVMSNNASCRVVIAPEGWVMPTFSSGATVYMSLQMFLDTPVIT